MVVFIYKNCNLRFLEFISCYYVQNYRLSKEGEAIQNQLEKRIVIDSGNPVNEVWGFLYALNTH